MPLFKRIFQGKSKVSNTLVALCIGDYSRLNFDVGTDVQQFEALLAVDDGSASPSQPTAQPSPSKGSAPNVSQHSFKAFRNIFQHLGGASASSLHDGSEPEAERHLAQFFKQLGGYSSVSFVAPAEDGLVPRDKVLSKLTKLFKQSTAPVVVVSYCGPSDERGNWRLSCQGPGGGGGGGSSVSSPTGSDRNGGGGSSTFLSFREVSMLWQRHRKHSQRLVLLLDCPNSGYWVSALRMLSKAEQLELSLGVQASDSISPLQSIQLTYRPGIFTQLFLSNNKWRRDPRRGANQPTQPGPAPQQSSTRTPQVQAHDPQQPGEPRPNVQPQDSPQPQEAPGGFPTCVGGVGGPIPRLLEQQWLPGMLPSYYATWLNDHLVDYGIALQFFNMQAHAPSPFVNDFDSEPVIADSSPGSANERSGGGSSGTNATASQLLSPTSRAQAAHRGWRSSTALLAAESPSALGRPSRLGDDVMSGGSDLWATSRPAADSRPAGGSPRDIEAQGGVVERLAVREVHVTSRAILQPDSARRRWSSLAESFAYTAGSPTSGSSPQTANGVVVGSPTNPLFDRVRMSTPQADFLRPGLASPHGVFAHRSPTLPGEDSLYKMCHDNDCSASNEQCSASVGGYGSLYGIGPHGASGGVRLASACATDDGAYVQQPPVLTSAPAPTERELPPTCTHEPVASLQLAAAAAAANTPRSPARSIAAVCLKDVGLDDDSTSGVALAAVAAARDIDLAVQRAQSDTAALKWDRRSIHAERCLLEDERGNGVTSSFTGPAASDLQGFTNELFGALHVVATERRLMARRAPLEGDESLDTLMRDADLERQASVASLPSAMLPRDIHRLGVVDGNGSGGAAAAAVAGMNAVGPTPNLRTSLLSSLTSSVPRIGGSALQLLAPRNSAMGFASVSVGVGEAAAAAAAPGGETAPASGVAPRQLSRLFLMSMGDGTSDGQLALDTMPAICQEEEEEEEEEHDEDGEEPEACSTPYEQGLVAALGARQGRCQVDGHRALQQRRNGVVDVTASLLETSFVEELQERGRPGEAGGEGVVPQQCTSAASLDWLQPSHSPAPSPVPTSYTDGQKGRAGGHAISSNMLRNVLRAQISIPESVDLDSSFAGPSAATRRPGRFEMAGSESSSFVFGDDHDRFEMLKLLRKQQVEAQGSGWEAEEEAKAEAAGTRCAGEDVEADEEVYAAVPGAGYDEYSSDQAAGAYMLSTGRELSTVAAAAAACGVKGGDDATYLLAMEENDGAYPNDLRRMLSRERSGRGCEVEKMFGRGPNGGIREAWGPRGEGWEGEG